MPEITKGVDFDTIAREWRCKWAEDGDKQSLQDLQKAMEDVMVQVGAVSGSRVQRVVCGGCHDFKVITSFKADKFAKWEEDKFAPEEEFLAAIKKIKGVTAVETQTYTTMPVKLTRPVPPPQLKKAKVWQIGRLKPDSKGFNVEGKILGAPKEVETKGAAKTFEVEVGDATGKITASLRGDQADCVKAGKVCTFRNAKVIMVKSHIRLVVDKWGKIEENAEATVEEVGDKDMSATEFELVKE